MSDRFSTGNEIRCKINWTPECKRNCVCINQTWVRGITSLSEKCYCITLNCGYSRNLQPFWFTLFDRVCREMVLILKSNYGRIRNTYDWVICIVICFEVVVDVSKQNCDYFKPMLNSHRFWQSLRIKNKYKNQICTFRKRVCSILNVKTKCTIIM